MIKIKRNWGVVNVGSCPKGPYLNKPNSVFLILLKTCLQCRSQVVLDINNICDIIIKQCNQLAQEEEDHKIKIALLA